MKSNGYWYLVLWRVCATIGCGMAALASLTPAQVLEVDAACHEVAKRWGYGRVSISIEKGLPRLIEISGTRHLGVLERTQVAVERPPPGHQSSTG
jgi:hypothetical protein